jgi:flagellar hook protein FlgE
MSIFTAMVNSVTGMKAQSFAIENISDNIANSQTTGYKRVDTSFQDMVLTSPIRIQRGGSVAAFSRGTLTLPGSVSNTGIGTNFSLNGDGFVAVRSAVGFYNGQPVFDGTTQFTRRGDFALDRNGNLVNGAGKYLMGYPIDPATGITGTGAPDVMTVNIHQLPARASTRVTYEATLPVTPMTDSYSSSTPGSEIWTAGQVPAGGPFTGPPLVTATSTPSSKDFAANSISGQSVRLYDGVGTPKDVQIRWAKLDSANGFTTWTMYVDSKPGASAATAEWTRIATVQFDPTGKLKLPTAPVTMNLSSRGLGNLSLDLTGGLLSQYALDSGAARVGNIEQDGYASGDLRRVEMSEDGRVMAQFSNGRSLAVGKIATAQFNAENMLKRVSGSAFEATSESGSPLYGGTGIDFLSGALEGSNTDVAEEFSKLIVSQQAYSANTRVITTAQQLLQDTINIIR